MDGNLRSLFLKNLPQVHWQSIESGMTGRGIPDTNGCFDGQEFWIEFKETQHWSVSLRPEQIGWLMRRARAGGRVFIAVRRAGQELWLLSGNDAIDLKENGLRGCHPNNVLATYGGGPRAWDWNDILTALAYRA